MEATQALRLAVQQVLVDMAVEGDLDGDINALDIDTVFEKAEEIVKTQDFYIRSHRREVLYSEYLSGQTEQNNALILLDEADEDDMAMNVVDVAEIYEGLTVKELKELITP